MVHEEAAREQYFLSPRGIHLLANDSLNLTENLQAEREPRVDSWRHTTDVAPSYKEFMACNLCIGGIFTQGADK